jgi:hypothetical protein
VTIADIKKCLIVCFDIVKYIIWNYGMNVKYFEGISVKYFTIPVIVSIVEVANCPDKRGVTVFYVYWSIYAR